MRLAIVQVPYDSGRFGERLGRGPLHLVDRGLVERLRDAGHEATVVEATLADDFRTEVGHAVALQRRVRAVVAAARAEGRLPVVLAGNCAAAALGVGSALPPDRTGVVWLDAHGDFNTPDTSPSGFFDGMALSILTGNCWRGLWPSMEGFAPLPEDHLLLAGARDLDPAEAELLGRSRVTRLSVAELRSADARRTALDRLAAKVDGLYLHVDLDVLDPATLRANAYAAPGGLDVDELVAFVRTARAAAPLRALAITAYDPAADPEDRGIAAATRVILAASGD